MWLSNCRGLGILISLVDGIHSVLHAAVALILAPFEKLDPLWGLTAVSAVLGVVLVFAYGKLSRQESIRKVKSDIYRSVLESVLYKHDLRLALMAQGKMLVDATRYFAFAVPPLLILGIPSLFILAQLNLWYGVRPLKIGEPAIVRVELRQPSEINSVTLSAPTGVDVTAPVRIPASRELFWRVTPKQNSSGELAVTISEHEYKIPIVSGDFKGPLVSASYSSLWERVLVPLGPIDSARGLVDAVSVQYPERDFVIGGLKMSWLVIFFIVSLMSGLVGSKVFGIAV